MDTTQLCRYLPLLRRGFLSVFGFSTVVELDASSLFYEDPERARVKQKPDTLHALMIQIHEANLTVTHLSKPGVSFITLPFFHALPHLNFLSSFLLLQLKVDEVEILITQQLKVCLLL